MSSFEMDYIEERAQNGIRFLYDHPGMSFAFTRASTGKIRDLISADDENSMALEEVLDGCTQAYNSIFLYFLGLARDDGFAVEQRQQQIVITTPSP